MENYLIVFTIDFICRKSGLRSMHLLDELHEKAPKKVFISKYYYHLYFSKKGFKFNSFLNILSYLDVQMVFHSS